MKTVSIAEYFQVANENDECSVNVKVEEKPDTSLNPKPHAVMDKTEKELAANEPNKKPLDGQELEPNLDLEFNTAEDTIKTGKPLEGGDEVNIEEVCQESDRMAKDLTERFNYLSKMEEERIALESEIPLQLAMLQAPEKITHGDVMLATESLKYKLKLLNIPPKNSKALNVITCESMNEYPATDLMITVEDEQTLLGKIKEAIIKVYNYIKNMIMKGINYITGIKDKAFADEVKVKINTVKTKVETVKDEPNFVQSISINNPLVTITAAASLGGYDVDKYYDNRKKILEEINMAHYDAAKEQVSALASRSSYDSKSHNAKLVDLYKQLDNLTRELLKAAHYEKGVTSMLKPNQVLFNVTLDDKIQTYEIVDGILSETPDIDGKDIKPDQDVTFDYTKVIMTCEVNADNVSKTKSDTINALNNRLKELKFLEEQVEKTPDTGDEAAKESLSIYKERMVFLKKEIQTMMTFPGKYMKQTIDLIKVVEQAIEISEQKNSNN